MHVAAVELCLFIPAKMKASTAVPKKCRLVAEGVKELPLS
jgi:hypothetical protein